MPSEIRHVRGRVRHETDKVKGSRFIATAAEVHHADDVTETLEVVAAAFKGATHHCHAFRLGPGGACFRAQDDGEPGGSAGRPILRQIESRGLSDTLVVVTRYFGGTKLGVGGLVRAYSRAAAEVLDLAPVKIRVSTLTLVLRFPWELSGAVNSVLAQEGLGPTSSEYGEQVVHRLEVPAPRAQHLARLLEERTAGRLSAQFDEPAGDDASGRVTPPP